MKHSHASLMVSTAVLIAAAVAMCAEAHGQERYWPKAAMCVSDVRQGELHEGEWGRQHAPNHDWYRLLHDHRGVSCCNGDPSHGDCRPAQARQDADGNWRVYLGGEWVIVPPEAVLDSSANRQPLHAHICAQRQTDYIYCFIPGSAGG
jgi:hypothetical protein